MIKIKEILLRLKNRSLLGVELRKDLIRWVQLSYGRGEYRLEDFGSLVLPKEGVSSKEFKSLIDTDMNLGIFKDSHVAIAISHKVVGFENISLSKKISYRKRESFLCFHLAKKLDLDPKDIVFDYQIVKGGDTANFMADIKSIAVKRMHILDQKDFFRGIGSVPKIIDVDIYAIERAVRLQIKSIAGLVVVVNVCSSSVLIMVLNCKEMVYLREYDFEKDSLKTPLQFVTEVVEKIREANLNFSKLMDQIVVGGDFVLQTNLLEEIQKSFGLSAILADPLSCIKKSEALGLDRVDKLSSSMLVSCGLALRVSDYGN